MAIVTPFPPTRNRKSTPVVHYAIYQDFEGTAELLPGSGYLFRCHGEREAIVVNYKSPELVLLGRCDLADAQRQADEAAGGFAAIVCGYGR